MNKNSWVACGLLSLLLTFVGVGAYITHLKKVTLVANTRADTAAERAQEAENKLPVLQEQQRVLQTSNSELSTKLAKALAARTPVLPPVPVPTTAPEVEAQLLTAGLVSRVVLTGENSLVLEDARKALQWHGDAIRLPSALSALATTEAALTASVALSNGFRSELAVCDTTKTTALSALEQRKVEVGQLRTANEALTKRASMSVLKGNLKLVVLVPVAAYIGWKVGKR